jgi:hypothetical protein
MFPSEALLFLALEHEAVTLATFGVFFGSNLAQFVSQLVELAFFVMDLLQQTILMEKNAMKVDRQAKNPERTDLDLR